jgi:hypothetical protein
MSNIESEDKNQSSYSELLEHLRNAGKKASEIIPPMCNQLAKENPSWDHEKLRERVKRDGVSAGFSVDYIIRLIPQKYKDQLKMIAGHRGAQATAQVLKKGGDEHESLPSEGAGIVRQTIDSPDFVKMGRRVEQLSSRVHELEEQLDLKNEMLRTTDGSDIKELTDKLESAEMEIGFLKEAKNGEELIKIKGNKGKNEFYYCDRVSIVILKREISKFESRGIKTFQIYLQAII